MLEQLREGWARNTWTRPPDAPVQLWSEGTRTVYVADEWGPAVPYPAIDRHDGTRNHGYVRLKGNPEAIAQLPEMQGWPEYQRLLECINATDSPIESVGCEKGYFPLEGCGDATVKLGSYTDVVFANPGLNDEPDNLLRLAAEFVSALEGCEEWWATLEVGVQRLRGLVGSETPWGLMIRVNNAGRDEQGARCYWGESISRLGDSIARLPAGFPSGS